MPTITTTVDIDFNLSVLTTDELVDEVRRRGIEIDEYAEEQSFDVSFVSDRELQEEVRARGYLISSVGNMTRADIDILLKNAPPNLKVGSEIFFAYEKLRELYTHAAS